MACIHAVADSLYTFRYSPNSLPPRLIRILINGRMNPQLQGLDLKIEQSDYHLTYPLVLCSASSSPYYIFIAPQISIRSSLSLLSAANIRRISLKHVFQLRLRHRDDQENYSVLLPVNLSTNPSIVQYNIFSRSSHRLPKEIQVTFYTYNIK